MVSGYMAFHDIIQAEQEKLAKCNILEKSLEIHGKTKAANLILWLQLLPWLGM